MSEAAQQDVRPPGRPERDRAIDVLRGIGIICVVYGHFLPSAPTTPIFWVHMPLFFALSGALYRPVAGWRAFGSWAAQRGRALLIPYAAFLLLTALAAALTARHESTWYALLRPDSVTEGAPATSPWLSLLLGGRAIGGVFVIYWFTTCLFVTQLLFAVLLLAIRPRLICAGLVAVAYVLAHVESALLAGPGRPVVPWALDTVLIALPFYALGFAGKRALSLDSRRARTATTLAVVAAVGLTACRAIGAFHYTLDLRALEYRHPALDLLVPVLFILALIPLSRRLARTRLGGGFALLGMTTMPIMYLHLPLAKAVIEAIRVSRPTVVHALVLGIICLFVPAALARLLFARFRLLRIGLLGAHS